MILMRILLFFALYLSFFDFELKATDDINELLGSKSFVTLPPQSEEGPIDVEISLHLNSIDKINENDGFYALDFYIWLEWQDERLAYEKGKFEGKKAYFSTKDVWENKRCWDPVIVFTNLYEPNLIDESYSITPQGKVRYFQHSKSKFKPLNSGFDYKRFPFDKQSLTVCIESLKWDDQNLIFRWSESIKKPEYIKRYSNLSLPEWDISSFETKSSLQVFPNEPNPYSRATFTFNISRKSGFYLWRICLPTFLLVLLSWSVFYLKSEDIDSQITLSVTTVFAVITFGILVSHGLPKISYLSILDLWMIISFGFCVISAFQAIVTRVYYSKGDYALVEKIDIKCRKTVPAAFVVIEFLIYHFYH